MGKHGSFRVIALATTQVCPLMAHSGHSIMSHLMSLSGVKRTCCCAPHMSAFDPKPTFKEVWDPFRASQLIATIACLNVGGDDEATRFHYARWWGGGLIAASGARTASRRLAQACLLDVGVRGRQGIPISARYIPR